MDKIKPTTTAICDAGPIIHLHELDHLKLLGDFGTILVPTQVRLEVKKHSSVSFDESSIPWSIVSANFPLKEDLKMMCQAFSLDQGEKEALSIMTSNPGSVFFTDDAAARLVASKMSFEVHGTIGILIRAARRNVMTPREVISTLRDLPKLSSLHIKPSLLEKAINQTSKHYGI